MECKKTKIAVIFLFFAGFLFSQEHPHGQLWFHLPHPARQWVKQDRPENMLERGSPWDPRLGLNIRPMTPLSARSSPPAASALEPAPDTPAEAEQERPPDNASLDWRQYQSIPDGLSLTGNLTRISGRIALKTERSTYYLAGIYRIIEALEELADGTRITVTGSVLPVPQVPGVFYFILD